MTLPFQGEMMRCVLCGRKERSQVESSNWRCVEVGGRLYYACPAEFPPDGSGVGAFKRAYGRLLTWILRSRQKRR